MNYFLVSLAKMRILKETSSIHTTKQKKRQLFLIVHFGLHLPVKYVLISLICLPRYFFPYWRFDLKYANKTNKHTDRKHKTQKTNSNQTEKTHKLMSWNPASTADPWLSWVQWKALVKSQMKLAGLPGKPPPCIGMAPTVTGEQVAAPDQGRPWAT